MSFHECGGNIDDNLCIPLPQWVEEIGRCNPNIYFTDSEGRCIPECLSWGVDKERVLLARTALEVVIFNMDEESSLLRMPLLLFVSYSFRTISTT